MTEKASMALEIVDSETIKELDTIASQYLASIMDTQNDRNFAQAFLVGEAIQELDRKITAKMMKVIMHLQGTSLGFRTDKDYPESVVKRCCIEAFLRGLTPVNNQFNIIAGNLYITKEGFSYKLKELDGLTDLRIDPDVPVMKDGNAIVTVKATWKMNGESDSLEASIPIRVNSGMGMDAILGKADRKAKARIYNRITGSELSASDMGDGPLIEGEVVAGKSNGKEKPPTEYPQTEISAEDEELPLMAGKPNDQDMG